MSGEAGIGAGRDAAEAYRVGVSDKGHVVGHDIVIYNYLDELAQIGPGDIQKIAASQIGLLTSYYNAVLAQANASFRWALLAAGIGLVFFLGAIVFLLTTQIQSIATVSIIGGALVEVIAGINFWLYGRTTTQLADFHQRLDQTQRFLLANSICESLDGDFKQNSRAQLVATIATLNLEQPQRPESGTQEQ